MGRKRSDRKVLLDDLNLTIKYFKKGSYKTAVKRFKNSVCFGVLECIWQVEEWAQDAAEEKENWASASYHEDNVGYYHEAYDYLYVADDMIDDKDYYDQDSLAELIKHIELAIAEIRKTISNRVSFYAE